VKPGATSASSARPASRSSRSVGPTAAAACARPRPPPAGGRALTARPARS